MPIDPLIARGYQGGIANAFYDAQNQKQRRDSLANEGQRRNALLQMDVEGQQRQWSQEDAQAAAEEQEDAAFEAARTAGDWDAMASIDPETTQMLWDFEQSRKGPAPIGLQQLGGYQFLEQGGKPIPGSVQAPQRAPLGGGGSVEAPADQRMFEYFQGLSPEQQAAYLNMKRSSATPQAAAEIATAKATATEQAKANVTAQADLPRVEGNAENMLATLDALEQSPGFDYLWGAYALTPGGAVPGTPQADAFAVWEQVQGKAFLEAFGTLKGGGQITEKEGEKATAAITRLSQRKQSAASARAAINDLRSVVKAGLARAQTRARSQKPAAEAAPTRRRFNPETGKIE